ncbi:ABC transporter ATP-binding protein [Pseudonocardia sp. N23]|uniref:ABC transporter ATP-binding protein n=1 Tax=Pseudonocardia sp. N23 TaxID=1987376 RepID=UPI000BFC6276|nr:ABC transporter ATP-binding protein [Pseudonocardia sp. N23]GAY07329.1 ABC-type multidrug transport system, ATPase component [Pseudonocardia sp. N23]
MSADVPADVPVDVRGLVKRFGRTAALDGLDLRVEQGEIHGFIGPNGSGKTTTLRVLLGLIRPDAGHVRVLGGDARRDAVELHRRMAYVPGDVSLWPDLTGGEVIDFLGALRGGLDVARRDALVERFALDPTTRSRAYSRGNRQKVALVAALSSDVELLVLDEPTTGLDPLVDAEFRRVLGEERDRGRTVLLSSHVLSEVEALADRMTIIRRGRTVESGSLPELRHLCRTTVTAELAAPVPRTDDLAGVHLGEVRGRVVVCDVDPAAMDGLMRRLSAAGIVRLEVRPPSLEQVFLAEFAPTTREASA